MWRRADLRAATLLLLVLAHECSGEVRCRAVGDGLHADYDTDCREYVLCERGEERARHACEPGRAYSAVAGACMPRRLPACVRRLCAPGDTAAYAAPGTACREYYRCDNGTARDRACPPGAWFDSERQVCARGAGACYEPVCAGLPDGDQPDPSHACRRRLRCRAGDLRAVLPCPPGEDRCPRAACPAPREAARALPVGDAQYCADDKCSSRCELEEDGYHASRASGCREWYRCAGGRAVERGRCEAGRAFSEARGACEPLEMVTCAPVRGRCFGRADGVYRDWRDCRSWLACRRERVVAHGSCEAGLVWDGAGCVSRESFHCSGPHASHECATRASGFYQDLASDCEGYFHCAGALRTELRCEAGRVFDGERCVAGARYACPSLAQDMCYGKADGLYRARGGGCRGHYACAAGVQSWRVCAPGLVFDEVERACVEARGACPADEACAGRPDGYHAARATGCRDYYYCAGGERLATFTCFASRVYDGRRCVEPDQYSCPGG